MAYIYAQPTLQGGMDQTLVEVVSTVPSVIYGLLMFIWGFVFLSGMATQKARTGYADTQMWAVMASVCTFITSLLLTIKAGMMNLETLGIVVAITVMCGLWLFLSRGRGEI